ncbi:MAG TPA: hypothetical protein VN157_16320 [Caulobacter sp.]|nr:hypothetical protein [Caulobacter sp.]
MRDFAFGPAVVAGVDLLRRRPWAILAVALLGAPVTFANRVTAVLSSHLLIPAFTQPASVSVINTATTGVNLLVFLLGVSVMAAAVSRGGRIRMGGDELRLFVLSLTAFLPLLIVLVMIGVAGAITSIGRLTGAGEDGVMFTALGLGVVLALALTSRLSLAGPMTVRDGAMRFMASWRLTRQRPWKIFGVFLVTVLMGAVVAGGGGYLLALAIQALKLDIAMMYDPSLAIALKAVVKPAVLAHVILQGLLMVRPW